MPPKIQYLTFGGCHGWSTWEHKQDINEHNLQMGEQAASPPQIEYRSSGGRHGWSRWEHKQDIKEHNLDMHLQMGEQAACPPKSNTFHLAVVTDGAVGLHPVGGDARDGDAGLHVHAPAVLCGLVALRLAPQAILLATGNVDVGLGLLTRLPQGGLSLVQAVVLVGVFRRHGQTQRGKEHERKGHN